MKNKSFLKDVIGRKTANTNHKHISSEAYEEWLVYKQAGGDASFEEFAGLEKPEYNERAFKHKVKNTFLGAGRQLVKNALELFYVTRKKECPDKIKGIIYGALAYFIMSADVVFDGIPVLGFTDDAGVLATALLAAELYVDDEVRQKAEAKLKTIFGG